MKSDIGSRVKLTQHLATAIGWLSLFMYSVYVLVEKLVGPEQANPFHVIAPVALLLVSIRAWRRYLHIRSNGPVLNGHA